MFSTVLLTSSPRSALSDFAFKDTMRLDMVYLQHASCLGNSNHAGAGRALLSIWALFRYQSAQGIVLYLGAFERRERVLRYSVNYGLRSTNPPLGRKEF